MSTVPEFGRSDIIEAVKNALREVADFPADADIEGYSFQYFHDFHKKVFSSALKRAILGVRNEDYYYDAVLNEDIVGNWDTLGDCITYIEEENILYRSDTSKVRYE